MIERTIKTQIHLSVAEIAKAFCDLTEDEQAHFFNRVDIESKKWGKPLCFQLQAISDSHVLLNSGRSVMESIGDYSKKETK